MHALLIALVVSAAPPMTEGKLWDLVLELQDPDRVKAVAEQLKPHAREAMVAMVRAARAGGTDASLGSLTGFVQCNSELGFGFNRFPENAGGRAAQLLFDWAKASPAFVEQLGASPDPLARILALRAVDKQSPLFQRLLTAAESETSPMVAELADSYANRCFADTVALHPEVLSDPKRLAELGGHTKLTERAKKLNPEKIFCKTAAQAGPLIDGFFNNGIEVSSWGTSNGEAQIGVKSGAELSAACALAVYEGLRKRGRYAGNLLEALLTDYMPAETRAAAAAHAQRDSQHLTKDQQKSVTEKVINDGFAAPQGVKVPVPENPSWASEDSLEAAIRQHTPGAAAAIEKAFVCRSHTGKEVALLGFVPTPEHAKAALEVAKLCREGSAGAVSALIRMKDAHALDHLDRALEDPWSREELAAAMRENWDSQWVDRLRRYKDRPFFSLLMDAAGHPEVAK